MVSCRYSENNDPSIFNVFLPLRYILSNNNNRHNSNNIRGKRWYLTSIRALLRSVLGGFMNIVVGDSQRSVTTLTESYAVVSKVWEISPAKCG